MTDSSRLADCAERSDGTRTATGEGREAFALLEAVEDAEDRNLEVIGEASKESSARAHHQLPEIPWRELARFRDLANRPYGLVLSDEAWVIVSRDLPRIGRVLSRFIADRPRGP
jgi:uncharacterized protein with HEPN domain